MSSAKTGQNSPHRQLVMISEWWERITKRFMDWIMLQARTDSDFSYKEFQEMQEIYKEIYGTYYGTYKPPYKQDVQK